MSSVLDFQKKTTVLIVISKPPLKWHENFLLHKRFFLFHAYEVENFYLMYYAALCPLETRPVPGSSTSRTGGKTTKAVYPPG